MLGIWLAKTAPDTQTAGEGARFWNSVMTDLRNRGVRDILIACCDGLPGFEDAICAAFPATVVQRCVVHLIRNALRPVARRDAGEVAKGTAARPANLARFNFLDARASDFYPNWDDAADTSVALLHTEAGRDPYDRGLTDLVGELSTRSEAFRARWAAHDVRLHRTGVKHFNHPAIGRLDLTFDAMEIPTDPGLTITCYTAGPGTPSDQNLKLLVSWGATHDQNSSGRDQVSGRRST